MKRRWLPVLVVAAFASLLSLSGCGSPPAVRAQKAFSLVGTRLVIDTESDLRLMPGSGPGIQVQRWLSGTPAKPGHSSWTLAGDTLRLSIDCTGLVFHCGSRFQVAVPPHVSVVVHSGDNNVIVSGLSGGVVIDGGAGTVQLTGTSGPLQISTGSGNITASAIRSLVVDATSNQGSVDIGFEAPPERVDIATTDGNATARVPVTGHQYHVIVTGGTGAGHSKVPDAPRSSSVVQVSSGNGNATLLPGS
jgi:hypothetical protein